MANIAIELNQALAYRHATGAAGGATPRTIAAGEGWSVADVICTSGPQDRPFEEQHSHFSLAVVAAGTFQYESRFGRDLMTPGSIMLGNPGQCYQCGHEHDAGDRCVAFWFSRDYFGQLAADAGRRGGRVDFTRGRLPPLRATSPIVACACMGVAAQTDVPWEELGVTLAASVIQLATGVPPATWSAPPRAEARVTRVTRWIHQHLDESLTLGRLATMAGLSPFHFLRTFERLTGVTPHQYVLRARLREGALRLGLQSARVIDIAFDCGFGDVSNFNRAFRQEFGVGPLQYRAAARRRGLD